MLDLRTLRRMHQDIRVRRSLPFSSYQQCGASRVFEISGIFADKAGVFFPQTVKPTLILPGFYRG